MTNYEKYEAELHSKFCDAICFARHNIPELEEKCKRCEELCGCPCWACTREVFRWLSEEVDND